MFVSEARIAANKRNALLSKGPTSIEGKRKSRANALKHGLCASVVVAEDAQLVQGRAREFYQTLRPQNSFHCWLVSEISLYSVRIDRCERQERRVRDKVALKAELTWDDDRKLEATLLGSQLANRPEVVVDQLRRTLHGCEWMMARWALLAHSADLKKAWTPEQVSLAFDLLGTPAEFRDGHRPGASLDFDGRVIEDSDDPAAVARREIASLKGRREIVADLDEVNRALAEADLGEDTDAELKRLRRYEGTLQSRLRWCLRQLQAQSPFEAPYPGLWKAWAGSEEPAPEPLPEVPPIPAPTAEIMPAPEPKVGGLKAVHPPIDLEPHEYPPPGELPNIPAILAARRQAKLRKADARRESKRRKLDKLRA